MDLALFMEITGADSATATNYLSVTEGNAEAAIALFMESGGADISSQHPRPLSNSLDNGEDLMEEEVRAPIAPRQETLMGDDDFGFGIRGRGMMGGSSASSLGRRRDIGTVFDPFGDDPMDTETHPRRPSDPTLTRLSTLFKPPIDLVFPGDFGAAREEAKSKKKWILITVIDKDEFACLVLNRDLWPDADVKSLVKENFVFLYMDSKSADGQRHATFYPIDSYPYVAIIDPTTGERVKTWSHAVSPLEFQSDVVEFLDAPHSAIEAVGISSSSKMKSSTRSVHELSEEEQMRLAMEASLGDHPQTAAAPIVIDDEEEDVQILESLPLATICKNIQPRESPEPKTGDLTRIQFRLPNGTRIVRQFAKSDRIRSLFEFIKAKAPDVCEAPFDLMNFREPLLKSLEATLDEAQLAGSSLVLDYI